MARNLGFDVARSVSMMYIVGVLHLSGYTGMSVAENTVFVSFIWSALGVFTFLSSFLLASKYTFHSWTETLLFYKKRLLRFYPLFFVSSILLVAIGFNPWSATWRGLLGLSPFWTPQPQTLWYIATLIFLYLVTPFLAVESLIKKSVRFLGVIAMIGAVDWCFHSVDPRVYYYSLVYFAGILAAKHFKDRLLAILTTKRMLLSAIGYMLLLCLVACLESRVLMLITGYAGIFVAMNVSLLLAKNVIGG